MILFSELMIFSHSFDLPNLPAAHPRLRKSLPTAQVAPQWSLCLDVSINRNNNNNLIGGAVIVQARILMVHSILLFLKSYNFLSNELLNMDKKWCNILLG